MSSIQPTGQPAIHLLSGGAAKGLVSQVQAQFLASTGYDIDGEFGAVGLMRDRFLEGGRCDMVILTQALIEKMVGEGQLADAGMRPIGIVQTGVACRASDPPPRLHDAGALKESLLAAPAIYVPDTKKSTAGMHFAKVLEKLGIDTTLSARLRHFPNGATAMHELSRAKEPGALGCTQVTEILYTPGVALAGLLPKEFELATTYVAALALHSTEPAAAKKLIELLTSAGTASLRSNGGFE